MGVSKQKSLGVVTEAATVEAVGHEIMVEELEAVQVKGKKGPIMLYRPLSVIEQLKRRDTMKNMSIYLASPRVMARSSKVGAFGLEKHESCRTNADHVPSVWIPRPNSAAVLTESINQFVHCVARQSVLESIPLFINSAFDDGIDVTEENISIKEEENHEVECDERESSDVNDELHQETLWNEQEHSGRSTQSFESSDQPHEATELSSLGEEGIKVDVKQKKMKVILITGPCGSGKSSLLRKVLSDIRSRLSSSHLCMCMGQGQAFYNSPFLAWRNVFSVLMDEVLAVPNGLALTATRKQHKHSQRRTSFFESHSPTSATSPTSTDVKSSIFPPQRLKRRKSSHSEISNDVHSFVQELFQNDDNHHIVQSLISVMDPAASMELCDCKENLEKIESHLWLCFSAALSLCEVCGCGLLLILDNVQWMDEYSCRLLQRIFSSCPNRLMTILVSRTGMFLPPVPKGIPLLGKKVKSQSQTSSLATLFESTSASEDQSMMFSSMAPSNPLCDLNELSYITECSVLPITQLSRKQIDAVLRELWKVDAVHPSVLNCISLRTNGLALFVQELAAYWQASNIGEVDGSGQWCFSSILTQQVAEHALSGMPSNMHSVISSQLDALTPQQQLIIKVLANATNNNKIFYKIYNLGLFFF